MMTAKQIGAFGERAAADYLIGHGYRVVKVNYHTRYGEIDIIAEKEEYTVFVEVKTRHVGSMGTPAEYVDRRKQEKILKSVLCYTDNLDQAMRFDVIEVYYNADGGACRITELNHIENAFGMS